MQPSPHCIGDCSTASGGALTSGSVQRVSLVMLRGENDEHHTGRALDLADVLDVRLDPRTPTRVLIQVGPRQMQMTAESRHDAVHWLQQLRNHVSATRAAG